MVKLFNKLIRDKLLFVLVISTMVTFILDFSLIIFDIIQFIRISKSAINLSASFVGFNIFIAVVNLAVIVFGIVYYFLNKRTIRNKNQ